MISISIFLENCGICHSIQWFGLDLAVHPGKNALSVSDFEILRFQDIKNQIYHGFEIKHWNLHCIPGSMPPFSDEPAEQKSKPLAFLNLSHVPTSAAKRRAPQRCLFGDEPAESVDADTGRGVGWTSGAKPGRKRPFNEKLDSKSTTSHATLFGDEGSEDDADPPKKNMVPKAFADEESEGGGTSSQSSGEEKFIVKRDTVFAFGWDSVATFKKATAWRENMDDPQASKPKRNYDNSKRAKDAQYMRRDSKGYYKRNGLDPTRLQKLFDANTCLCPLMVFGGLFYFLLPLSWRPHPQKQYCFLWYAQLLEVLRRSASSNSVAPKSCLLFLNSFGTWVSKTRIPLHLVETIVFFGMQQPQFYQINKMVIDSC